MAIRWSTMVMPKNKSTYATTEQIASCQANCLISHIVKVVPHNFVPINPNMTASIAVSSANSPLISPLTRPMRRGKSMMISSQDMIKIRLTMYKLPNYLAYSMRGQRLFSSSNNCKSSNVRIVIDQSSGAGSYLALSE